MLCAEPVLARGSCHILLAKLRPPGQTAYVIPRGYGFDHITCANYTFEIAGWVMFAFATRTLTAFLFIAAGAYQMAVWAKAKHARLLKARPSLGPPMPCRHAHWRSSSACACPTCTVSFLLSEAFSG